MANFTRSFLAANMFVITLAAQDQHFEFEVASIKSNNSGNRGFGIRDDKGLWRATNVSVKFLVQVAFEVLPDQVLGLPSWGDSERFDVEAKVEDDPSITPAEADRRNRLRVQALLASRFHFAMHREMKEWQAYVLVAAKKGPKLTPSARKEGSSSQFNNGHFEANGVDMDRFAKNLANRLGRPVVNETGSPAGSTSPWISSRSSQPARPTRTIQQPD